MLSNKHDKTIYIFTLIFLSAAVFYYFLYSPVTYLNGVKIFNIYTTQGDVQSYLNFFQREIEGKSFFEWFLKLDQQNLALVYYSWLSGSLGKIGIHDLLLNSVILFATYKIVATLAVKEGEKPLFSIFALATCFSMLVYMQTFTKEIFAFLLIPIAVYGIRTKKYRFTILAMICLSFVRIYFSFIIATSIFIFILLNKTNRTFFLGLLGVFAALIPLFFGKIFISFFSIPSLNSAFGVSGYYLLSLKHFGLFVLWLPFKIFQNITEPILAFINTPQALMIYNAAIPLDFLTSCSMVFMLFHIWLHRKNLKKSPDFVKFLTIFCCTYLAIAACLPLVHFRYLVPLLPILGVLADLLRSPASQSTPTL